MKPVDRVNEMYARGATNDEVACWLFGPQHKMEATPKTGWVLKGDRWVEYVPRTTPVVGSVRAVGREIKAGDIFKPNDRGLARGILDASMRWVVTDYNPNRGTFCCKDAMVNGATTKEIQLSTLESLEFGDGTSIVIPPIGRPLASGNIILGATGFIKGFRYIICQTRANPTEASIAEVDIYGNQITIQYPATHISITEFYIHENGDIISDPSTWP